MRYLVLKKNIYKIRKYSIVPLRRQDIFKIKKWRNDQLDILRQEKLLTDEDQRNYYKKVILPSFFNKQPDQILFSFLFNKECIGYGGLVHINWSRKIAEMSYLADSKRVKNKPLYEKEFSIFINFIKKIGFGELTFKKIFTETYDIRPRHIKILEANRFKLEKRMKNQMKINGQYVDSLIHGLYPDKGDIDLIY